MTKGRKTFEDGKVRNQKITAYVTPDELTAVTTLGDGQYAGCADVIRHALALLIVQKHPELTKHLRADLTP